MGRTRTTRELVSDSLAQTLERVERLGSIPPGRILMVPLPGTATEKDLNRVHLSGRKNVELIDGVLVEKATGTREALLANVIGQLLGAYAYDHDLGAVLGPDGMQRLARGLVRIPDVSFIPWDRWPEEKKGERRILTIYPDLAVEVLSESNTKAEIERKLRDLFSAGMKVAWVIQPKDQTAKVFSAPDAFAEVTIDGVLDAAPAIPGFRLPMTDLFARTRRRT